MTIPDVSGSWNIDQGTHYVVAVQITQDGGQISGSASYSPTGYAGPRGGFLDDTVSSMEAHGTVTDTDFSFVIDWNNGTRGQYSGTFQADGRLTGMTFDTEDLESQATWISDKTFSRPAESGDGSGKASPPTPAKEDGASADRRSAEWAFQQDTAGHPPRPDEAPAGPALTALDADVAREPTKEP